LDSVGIIYFSPTGTTKKVVEAIAGGIGADSIEVLDLTSAKARGPIPAIPETDLTILGVPVYTGRVPFQVVEALQHMRVQRTPAALVVVYGNREYEDALLELSDIASRIGFLPIAGAAFVGEHSFSTTGTPIAAGRPDHEDLEQAVAFGTMLRKKFDGMGSLGNGHFLKVPGNFPYRERAVHRAVPESAMELCKKCGVCEDICPEGAIVVSENGVASDKDICLLCCACVKACPTGARRMNDPELLQIAERLSTVCGEQKSPEFFLK
jgi:ferredoxin